MTNRHSFVLGLFITASLLCTSRTAWGNSEINTYTKTDFAMDTVVSETLYTTGEDITADIISALKDVEENWISWTKESSHADWISLYGADLIYLLDDLMANIDWRAA